MEILTATSSAAGQSISNLVDKAVENATSEEDLELVTNIVEKSKGTIADKIINSANKSAESKKKITEISAQEKLENFRKMLEQMDEHNITYATENSASIFGKKKSREVIEENYTPMVKYSKKPGYRPILKVKLPVYDDKPSFRVFNKEREMIPIYSETEGVDLSVFTGGSEAVHLLEFTGLWKTNNKFGGSWKLVQSKMYTTKQLAGYMMDDSDEDD